MMIKIIKINYLGDFKVALYFSDGLEGIFDGKSLFQRQGSLLEPIKDENYFRKVYIDAGALSWPHGLELSPVSLWKKSVKSKADKKQYPFWGKPIKYLNPTDPVAEADWEVYK